MGLACSKEKKSTVEDKPSTTVTDQPTPNENKLLSLNEFAQESLKVHNILRRKHGASDLKLNDKLTVDAKKWADYLAKKQGLEHTTEKVGENLAWSSTYMSPQQATENWYNEIKDYNFKNHGFKSNTGHFTQVVWKSTVEMGAAISRDSNGCSYVVARYNPPGNMNMAGYFEKNVGDLQH